MARRAAKTSRSSVDAARSGPKTARRSAEEIGRQNCRGDGKFSAEHDPRLHVQRDDDAKSGSRADRPDSDRFGAIFRCFAGKL